MQKRFESEGTHRPDYKGDGVAVWIAKDKNNVEYLSIKVLGAVTLRAFVYPYPEVKREQQ